MTTAYEALGLNGSTFVARRKLPDACTAARIANLDSNFMRLTSTPPSSAPFLSSGGPPSDLRASRTRGFGTVLAMEQELQSLVRSLTVAPQQRVFAKFRRILENHVEQIGVVLGLLDARDSMLPTPIRFAGLASAGLPLLDPSPLTETRPTVRDLIARHQALRQHIGVLIADSGNKDAEERHLKEAAQRHEEMEWMLTSVLNEDAVAGDLSAGGADLDRSAMSQESWENEGGPPLVPESQR